MGGYIYSFVKEYATKFSFTQKLGGYVLKEVRIGNIRRLYHWLFAGHVIKYWRVKSWLREIGPKYFQIGGGRHHKVSGNWINGDILSGEIYLNATTKLPFPKESIDAIFSEQFVEHLAQEEALYFLKEAYRVLKKGGIIRQATPDLKKIVALYEEKNNGLSLSTVVARHMRIHRNSSEYAEATGCQFINDIFRLWGHKYIYDQEALESVVKRAGFNTLNWVSFGSSEHVFLRNLERHADEEWMKDGFVMVCEARK